MDLGGWRRVYGEKFRREGGEGWRVEGGWRMVKGGWWRVDGGWTYILYLFFLKRKAEQITAQRADQAAAATKVREEDESTAERKDVMVAEAQESERGAEGA